ncbi:MAG: exonuclease domain-containing protein, partial [Oscillospiraceae bacterium]
MKIPEIFEGLAEFDDTEIVDITLVKDREEVIVGAKFQRFGQDRADRLRKALSSFFPGLTVSVDDSYPEDQWSLDAVFRIIREIEKENPVNGFFDECGIAYDVSQDDTVKIGLAHGGMEIMEKLDIAGKMGRLALKRFGKSVTFEISSDSGNEEGKAEYKSHIEERHVKEELKNLPIETPAGKASGDLVQIMGRNADSTDLIPLSELTTPRPKVKFAGVIFKKDERATKRNGKILEFWVTDYTSSVRMKFIETQRNSGGRIESLSEGDFVIVNGSYRFDDYSQANIVIPRAVAKSVLLGRTDDAPEKRIELHMHSNMSTLDGISASEDIVDAAAAFGHSAVAITDHAVVQGFPKAAEACAGIRKKNPDFKVLYGCELYYVDDSARIVHGKCSDPVDGEFVVFDLETTGLHCSTDRIIEIGAVVLKNGEIGEHFTTFVDPGMPISPKITNLTGITQGMVSGAPKEDEAVPRFLEFTGGRTLIAHNASFDVSFIRSACSRLGIGFDLPYIDTVALAQCLYPDMKKFTLDAVTNSLGLPSFKHHRADDDAAADALIYAECSKKLKSMGIENCSDVNAKFDGINYRHAKMRHMTVFAENTQGLSNLYHIVTDAHLKYFYRKPRVPLSCLKKYREGLILGSACEMGELINAVLEGEPHEDILALAEKYDFLEVQPAGNYRHLFGDQGDGWEASARDLIKAVVELGEETGKPVCATSDAHYIEKRQKIYRKILTQGQHLEDSDSDADLYFRTTDEMMAEFSFLGNETAKKIVIDNPAIIAGMIESTILPIPKGTFTPYIENAEEQLESIARTSFAKRYGDKAPQLFKDRLEKELSSIIEHGYAVLYMIAQKLVQDSNEHGYHVGSRGSVGSSFIANLVGISEVNPLPAHYRCEKCGHIELLPGVESGFDVEDGVCPECGGRMRGDGHNIPFETFLGFHGEKAPDIDLNFSGEYQ